MNEEHHPNYYPKAVLKAAIGDLVEALRVIRKSVNLVENPFVDELTQRMIAKHEIKSGDD